VSTPTYPQRPFAVPPDATEVVLVRHGASQAHVPGESFELIEGGHSDPPLAPEGREQADRVGARLAAAAPHAVFVTPLQRTAQTAAPLLAATGMTATVVPELREIHLGEWEGGELRVRLAHRDPLAVEMLAAERWSVIPGAEEPEPFARRVRAGLDTVVGAAGPGTSVAAFVHGGIVGELCRQATGSRPFAFVHADNASITRIVAFADGRLLLRSFNDTSHLSAP
jgi:2,3-bisphosphoglycerate-dependent phosphoglycerate mutase